MRSARRGGRLPELLRLAIRRRREVMMRRRLLPKRMKRRRMMMMITSRRIQPFRSAEVSRVHLPHLSHLCFLRKVSAY